MHSGPTSGIAAIAMNAGPLNEMTQATSAIDTVTGSLVDSSEPNGISDELLRRVDALGLESAETVEFPTMVLVVENWLLA